MNRKSEIEGELRRRIALLRIKAGLHRIRTERKARMMCAAFCLLLFLMYFGYPALYLRQDEVLRSLLSGMNKSSFPIVFASGAVLIVYVLGVPRGALAVRNGLQRAGIVNHAGEAPVLLNRGQDTQHPDITVLELYAPGITETMLEDRQAEVEAALDAYLADWHYGSRLNTMVLRVTPSDGGLPSVIRWKGEYENDRDFALTPGMSLTGLVTIDLAVMPHVLIGGSTGSGKTVLFKSLLREAYRKGAEILIADFKGGVDFPPVWHRCCTLLFEEDELRQRLCELTEELEARKVILKESGLPNIHEYNRQSETPMKRILFAVDEFAEIFDKTGRSKADREIIDEVVGYVSTIARQGRAMGIHLILATQRPDANILPGQIKNNLDIRICGRADQVLSQIILDSTDAKDLIPKASRGRFIMGDGTIFQGFLIDESEL